MADNQAAAILEKNATREEALIFANTFKDFLARGETDVKCPRCGGGIVFTDCGSADVIGCENNCVLISYRGL